MSTSGTTVHDRVAQARTEYRPRQLAAGLALAAAIGFALLFVQEPLVHEALHNFRHGTGITCH